MGDPVSRVLPSMGQSKHSEGDDDLLRMMSPGVFFCRQQLTVCADSVMLPIAKFLRVPQQIPRLMTLTVVHKDAMQGL